MKLHLLLVTLVFVLTLGNSPSAFADQQSYLCSAEESTGYDYTNGRWLRERFRADARYLVKLNDASWTVYDYDLELEHTSCSTLQENVLNCDLGGNFIMDINTMKFSITDTRSYVHSTRRNRDSVVLTLGACVPMQ